jgi:Cu-Zn family superoxide dismutase
MIRTTAHACILALSLVTAVASAQAAAAQNDTVHVGKGWATAPIGASKNGAAFLTLYNTGQTDAALRRAEAPGVSRVELHRTTMDEGVMRMRPVDRIVVPARGHAALRPGGLHVMLIGAGDLTVGGEVELTLHFAEAESRTVSLPVRQAGTKPDWLRQQALVAIHRVTAEGTGARVGTLALRQHQGGLLAIPLLQGLEPGPHAMHVHENATCAPAGSGEGAAPGGAAGGHFDPEDTGHYAGPYAEGARGDLPNLMAEANGTATIPVLAPRVQLSQVRGRSVMLHAGADRYGPRLPGADALAARDSAGGHTHADDGQGHGQDHGMHGGMRMYCGVIPE